MCISLLPFLFLVFSMKENRSTGSICSGPDMVSHTFYHILEKAVLFFYTMPVVPQHFRQVWEMQFLLSLLLKFSRILEKILNPKSWIKISASPAAEFTIFCHWVCSSGQFGKGYKHLPHSNKQAGPEATVFLLCSNE